MVLQARPSAAMAASPAAEEAVSHALLAWVRLMWRLEKRCRIKADEALQATASQATAKGGRRSRIQEPTEKQLRCSHPESMRRAGANQHARYVKCTSCDLRLKYEPKNRAEESKQVPQPLPEPPRTRPSQRPSSAMATAPSSCPPGSSRDVDLDLLVQRMLAPMIEAQQAQGARLQVLATTVQQSMHSQTANAQMLAQQQEVLQQQLLQTQDTMQSMMGFQAPASQGGLAADDDGDYLIPDQENENL